MFELLLFWLLVGFAVVVGVSIVGYFVTRWLFIRTAEGMARQVDRRVGAAAARSFTNLANYAHE